MKIDINSFGTLAIVFAAGALVIWLSLRYIPNKWVGWAITLFAWTFCTWQLFFFRVPERVAVGTDKVVTSAADGKVVISDVVFEDEVLKRECRRVCVYMDFFDVHANFWPVTGEVSYYKYHPGEHLLAFRPKASEENEHSSTVIRTPDGQEVLFRQLAGTFARRIVCYSQEGLGVTAGEQCGIIKFGSRLDIFLPLDAEVKVEIGQKVRACESVIAVLK